MVSGASAFTYFRKYTDCRGSVIVEARWATVTLLNPSLLYTMTHFRHPSRTLTCSGAVAASAAAEILMLG